MNGIVKKDELRSITREESIWANLMVRQVSSLSLPCLVEKWSRNYGFNRKGYNRFLEEWK